MRFFITQLSNIVYKTHNSGQLKLLMLFLRQGLNGNYDFRLATEWEDAEKFDDLVFRHEDGQGNKKYRFLQAKHKLDDNKKIGIGELLTQEINGEFNLEKYLISYLKIKNNPVFTGGELEDFTICTNIDLELDNTVPGQLTLKIMTKGKNKDKTILVEEITTSDVFFKNGGSRYQLKSNQDIIDHLKNGKEVKKETQGKTINIDTEINNFLQKLIFAVSQPNERILDRIITEELGEKFNLMDADFIYSHFQADMLNWMKEKGKK